MEIEKNPNIEHKNLNLDNDKDKTIFLDIDEGKCGVGHIKITFDALIDKDVFENKKQPQDWYKDLSIDRSDASKIHRGLMIPPHHIRLKISSYFNCDSTTIWRIEDLDEIRKLLQEQKKGNKKNEN